MHTVVLSIVALAIVWHGSADAQSYRFSGNVTAASINGPDCPKAERLWPIYLAIERVGPDRSFSGILYVGEEMIKSVRGSQHGDLELVDPLVDDANPAANRLALDRWPNPATGRLDFQFSRLRCRVTDAHADLRNAEASTTARFDRAAHILSDVHLTVRVTEEARRGDPRLGVAEIAGVHERLTAALGADHAVAIEARSAQMRIAQDTGKVDDALRFGREIVDRMESIYGRQSGPAARARAPISYTHWRAGRSGEAIRTAREALAGMEAVDDASSSFYIRNLSALSSYLSYSGEYSEGIAVAERVEQLFRRNQGAGSESHLNSVSVLARVLILGGQARQARRILLDVLPLAHERVGPNNPAYVQLVEALGNAAAELRLHDEARAAFEFVRSQYEATLGPNNTRTITALVNVAFTRLVAGDDERGEALLIDAYSRLPATAGRQESRGSIPLNLAELLLRHNQLERAESWIREALKVNREYFGENHPRTAKAIGFQGQLLRRQGNLVEASDVLMDAAQRQKKFGGTAEVDRLVTLSELSLVSVAQGDIQHAARLLDEFVAMAEAQRVGPRADAGSRRQFFADWAVDYKRLAALRIRLQQTETAFTISELSKGRTLLDQLSDSSVLATSTEARGLADQLRTLAAEIVAIEQRAATFDAGSQLGAETATALVERRSRYETLKSELDRLQPQLAEQNRAKPISMRSARTLLRRDEVAISYLLTKDTLSTFVLTTKQARASTQSLAAAERQSFDAYSKLVGAPLDSRDRAWLSEDGSIVVAVSPPNPVAKPLPLAEIAARVSDLLLGRARIELGKLRRVLIIPDSVLAAVPFDTLLLDGRMLAERHEVHYAQSMSVYGQLVDRLGRERAFQSPLLAIGAPSQQSTVGESVIAGTSSSPATRYRSNSVAWTPLPFALEEVERVVKIFPGATKLTGDNASEETLQQMNEDGRLQRYRYLHFATHAFFSADRPDLSAIVLKQPGSTAADGFLTVNELSSYRLKSELTVLSACETAAGKVVDGDGVMGFAFALLVAGNANTLAALWRVPDDATEQLMTRFFLGVKRGLPHSVALAAAKREVRAIRRFAASINWAGFVLYGT